MNLDLKLVIFSYLELEEFLVCIENPPLAYVNNFYNLNITKTGGQYKYYYSDSYKNMMRIAEKNKYVRNGDCYTVKYLSKNGIRFTQSSMEFAIVHGHLNIVKYFQKIGIVLTPSMLKLCIVYGQVEILKYFYNTESKSKRSNKSKFSRNLTNTAVRSVNLEALQYLYSIGFKPYKYCLSNNWRGLESQEIHNFISSIGIEPVKNFKSLTN